MKFFEYELTIWKKSSRRWFEDDFIDIIFGYKFVLRTAYSFESGEEIWW